MCNTMSLIRRMLHHDSRQTLLVLHRYLYYHDSNKTMSVALRLKRQLDPHRNLTVRKGDEHTKYRLGSPIQKFIRYYICW